MAGQYITVESNTVKTFNCSQINKREKYLNIKRYSNLRIQYCCIKCQKEWKLPQEWIDHILHEKCSEINSKAFLCQWLHWYYSKNTSSEIIYNKTQMTITGNTEKSKARYKIIKYVLLSIYICLYYSFLV